MRMRGVLKGACHKYFLWDSEWRHTRALLTNVKENTKIRNITDVYLLFIAFSKPPAAFHLGVQVTWFVCLLTSFISNINEPKKSILKI